jgi:hypothetical protein
VSEVSGEKDAEREMSNVESKTKAIVFLVGTDPEPNDHVAFA